MRKLIVKILLVVTIMSMVFILSGCTLKIETTDNSVSASLDGDTTEKVDNIIDWLKDRIGRIFVTEDTSSTDSAPIGDGKGQIL